MKLNFLKKKGGKEWNDSYKGKGVGGRDRLGRFHGQELAQEYINVNDVMHGIKIG